MGLTVDQQLQQLQQGAAAHNLGNLQEAERLYRAILQVQPNHPEANHNLGLIAVSMNQSSVAIPFFKSAIDANPNVESFWLSYIEALIAERQFADAKQALKKSKKKGVGKEKIKTLMQKLVMVKVGKIPIPVPPQAELQKLINHYQNERYADAERLALSIIKQFPDHPSSYNVLGGVYKQTGKLSELIIVSEKVVALSPKDAEAHSNLGLTLKELGRLEESELSYKRALKLKPDFVQVHKNLGNVLGELGKLSEAEESYKQAVALKHDDAEVHNNLGNTLLALGKLGEAETSYGVAIGLRPDFVEAHFNLGAVRQQQGRSEAAEVSYKQAIALKHDWAEAHFNLGFTLKDLARLDEAEASYRQAIALKADFAEAHNNLGNTLKDLGRLEEAVTCFKQAVVLQADFSEPHNNLGNTLKDLGRLDEAEKNYRQAILLQPDYAETHNNLGNILKELGRLEEAVACYMQAIELKPDFSQANNSLGSTFQELGKSQEAEASYRQAIALNSEYAEAHNNLGNTLKESGRLEEAETSYRKAITFKSDFTEARYNLGILLFESRQYSAAADQFELSDIHQSKRYAIKCSYLQDEESVFYEKFDLLVSQGETNAVIGSLGFCAEFKYGIKKLNSFCNEPLKYVEKTDLNEHYDFENIFIKTARDVLIDDSLSHKVQGHLTNGVQTSGNIFSQGKVPETEIESIIHAEIEKYRIRFKESEEGFIKNWPTSYYISGWLVCMQSGGKLASHMHDDGWITGSIYINVPPKSKNDSGNLVLCLSDQEPVAGVKKSQESIIDVVTGSLCFFPSSLHHYTVPFEEEENRIVLAFDVIPTK